MTGVARRSPMGMSTARCAKVFTNLAVATGIATALPTGTMVWAQAQKDQAVPPREAMKVEVKIEVAPVRIAAPAIVVEKMQVVEKVEKGVGVRFGIPAIPLPAAPGGAVAAEANLEPMIAQTTQQLRPLLRTELRFLSSASEPSPTQRREIALEGARAAKDAAKKVASVQNALQNGGWNGGTIPDARKLIREGLQGAAKARLSPEQFARYQEELDLKAKDQRKAITLNLVANLDRLLFLSNEQREKIGEALLSHWDERTFPTLENLANYETYFPVLPDRYIAPILNDAQRNTWNGVQKVTFGQSFNFQFNNGVGNDPADEDEDEKAAMAEVEKKK
jgi:hypothetical protein